MMVAELFIMYLYDRRKGDAMELSRKVTERYIVKLGESIYAMEAESRRDAASIATIYRNHILNYSFASDPERISDDHFESYLVDEHGRPVREEDQPEPEVWKEWEYRNQYGDEPNGIIELRLTVISDS